ncbi:hypothetical protein K503DRAFT_274437 [Rhizopogon vinicolor AM-OR11-026]|uniref:G-patch domain-containing protein n=1 Tax=Rhizopogon vinicolor AM-OR11-026 TaxID=1314800 RepID=A0A1B7NDD6_9AGAM|nr:hypothetical protein K503DRAFT_274437 [Rhizopogon vinicolor AM-OR11-026]
MATVAHRIRSDYDHADRERLEEETGQIPIDDAEEWNTAPTFSATRRVPPPSFVPARIRYDEWGSAVSFNNALPSDVPAVDNGTSEWYRALTRDCSKGSGNQPPSRPSSTPSEAPKPKTEATTKNNWFIKRALQSEPPTKPSSPAPSLADLLARDPPPLPSEERFAPPVWLAIGPSNKGFNLLQKHGWNEGEGLGAHVARSRRPRSPARKLGAEPVSPASSRGASIPAGDRNSRGILPDIIDLTQSDSESEDDFESLHRSPSLPLPSVPSAHKATDSHSQKSLLTPIPTILKSDRLGIGLKAKTEGPYKQSKKRVTHNQAALASHIRAAEELRRKKAEVGRGRRGFVKVRRREENERKHMLAYLNE